MTNKIKKGDWVKVVSCTFSNCSNMGRTYKVSNVYHGVVFTIIHLEKGHDHCLDEVELVKPKKQVIQKKKTTQKIEQKTTYKISEGEKFVDFTVEDGIITRIGLYSFGLKPDDMEFFTRAIKQVKNKIKAEQ
jgi:hypothetical protein